MQFTSTHIVGLLYAASNHCKVYSTFIITKLSVLDFPIKLYCIPEQQWPCQMNTIFSATHCVHVVLIWDMSRHTILHMWHSYKIVIASSLTSHWGYSTGCLGGPWGCVTVLNVWTGKVGVLQLVKGMHVACSVLTQILTHWYTVYTLSRTNTNSQTWCNHYN